MKSFWMGGGTPLFRSCGRQEAEDGNVEVATVFTPEEKGNSIGYSTTRKATEKLVQTLFYLISRFPYVCATKCEDLGGEEMPSAPVQVKPDLN